jgi:hypothetical protein
MPHDKLLDLLKQAKATLDTLTTDESILSDLSDDEFEIVVPIICNFFNSVQAAANRLAMLRRLDEREQFNPDVPIF